MAVQILGTEPSRRMLMALGGALLLPVAWKIGVPSEILGKMAELLAWGIGGLTVTGAVNAWKNGNGGVK